MIEKWLIKAMNDFRTTKRLLDLPEEEFITNTLAFHCQQSAAKLLKAYLKRRNNKRMEKIDKFTGGI
jgi:HEPN domain-containing protein